MTRMRRTWNPPLRSSDRVVIVGAGPAGLGTAEGLQAAGFTNWLLLEALASPGGLAGSARDTAGFTWDYGGHVVFSSLAPFLGMIERAMPGRMLAHTRSAWVHAAGRFVPYPLQLHLHRLPPEARDACLAGLRAAALAGKGGAHPQAGFGQWAQRAFGRGLVDLFMRPYNEKVWQCRLGALSTQWLGSRVATEPPSALLRRAEAGEDGEGWGPNRPFFFPRSGGTGAIWRSLARGLPAGRLRFGARVSRVDLDSRQLALEGGERIAWDVLVSTMPLTTLCGACRTARGEAPSAAGLRHSAALVCGFGLGGRVPAELAGRHWIYFADPDVPFYRVTVFSSYASANVPDARRFWSLLAECAFPGGTLAPGGGAVEAALDALVRLGWVNRDRVATQWSQWLPHAYPVPTRGRDARLRRALGALRARGVFSRGRFGAWQYEAGNMDHAYVQGRELASQLLCGREPSLPAVW